MFNDFTMIPSPCLRMDVGASVNCIVSCDTNNLWQVCWGLLLPFTSSRSCRYAFSYDVKSWQRTKNCLGSYRMRMCHCLSQELSSFHVLFESPYIHLQSVCSTYVIPVESLHYPNAIPANRKACKTRVKLGAEESTAFNGLKAM